MVTLITTIFLASLTGSLHCLGMCGPFLAIAVGVRSPGDQARKHLIIAYHCGRLLSYMLLGAIAGVVGSAIDLGVQLIGIQHVSSLLAGVIIVIFGIASLLRIYGIATPLFVVPNRFQRLSLKAHHATFKLPQNLRPLVVGVLTTLLPCGWLYVFVITAAGTGDPLLGILTMGVFWVGTLPALTTIGIGMQKLTGTMAPRLAFITCIAIIAVGLYTVSTRLPVSTLMSDGPLTNLKTMSPSTINDRAFKSVTGQQCGQHNE